MIKIEPMSAYAVASTEIGVTDNPRMYAQYHRCEHHVTEKPRQFFCHDQRHLGDSRCYILSAIELCVNIALPAYQPCVC